MGKVKKKLFTKLSISSKNGGKNMESLPSLSFSFPFFPKSCSLFQFTYFSLGHISQNEIHIPSSRRLQSTFSSSRLQPSRSRFWSEPEPKIQPKTLDATVKLDKKLNVDKQTQVRISNKLLPGFRIRFFYEVGSGSGLQNMVRSGLNIKV